MVNFKKIFFLVFLNCFSVYGMNDVLRDSIKYVDSQHIAVDLYNGEKIKSAIQTSDMDFFKANIELLMQSTDSYSSEKNKHIANVLMNFVQYCELDCYFDMVFLETEYDGFQVLKKTVKQYAESKAQEIIQ